MGALPKLLHWPQPPRTVLIVTKPESERTRAAFRHVARWLHTHHPDMNIVVERSVAEEAAADKQTHTSTIPDLVIADWENGGEELRRTIDFVITLGGDGTILHTSSLFPRDVPPIISFSLGTLGFLLPFGIETFPSALSKVIQGPVPLLHRMRLACAIYKTDGSRITAPTGDLQAMNDIVLHRGRYPHLTITECSVDGEFLTGAVADGLIVATPTGSTAYSLSAGGPLVHPSVPALVLTPICPRSLSFRPALLPADATVRLRLSKRSRETADVSVDGREVFLLGQEEYVEVGMSEYHIPCISRTAGGKDWVEDINRTLKWNQGFVNTFKEGE
ncbi:ATP-NAD kinase-like domain-containing protein [Powellomyces hirtus]|nr:ATP-NAD kinase-like domain-containing protein [Powellomyces hirtus]